MSITSRKFRKKAWRKFLGSSKAASHSPALEGKDGYRRIRRDRRTTATTINKWINWYRSGIEALLSRPVARRWQEPRFTPKQWSLPTNSPREPGTARDAQRWLKATLA